MFLTRDELKELTGYQLNAYQCNWLTARCWRFERSATGRPIVLRAYAESRMNDRPAEPAQWSPNLAAIKKVA